LRTPERLQSIAKGEFVPAGETAPSEGPKPKKSRKSTGKKSTKVEAAAENVPVETEQATVLEAESPAPEASKAVAKPKRTKKAKTPETSVES
jgi:hypothetical protein